MIPAEWGHYLRLVHRSPRAGTVKTQVITRARLVDSPVSSPVNDLVNSLANRLANQANLDLHTWHHHI
jgi:hypothetical protein